MLEEGKRQQSTQRIPPHHQRENPKSAPQDHTTYGGSAETCRSDCDFAVSGHHDNCFEVESNARSFIGVDGQGQEREATVEDGCAHCGECL